MKILIATIIAVFSLNLAFSQPYLSNTVLIRVKSFHLNNEELNQMLANENAYIVRRLLPLKASISYGNSLHKSANNDRLRKIANAEEPLLRTYVVKYDGEIDAKKFCYYLRKEHNEIEIAEPYYLQKVQGYIPNDQAVSNQQTLLTQIKAYDAWAIEKGDSNIVIGISDNAIQQTHPDLKDNIAKNTDESINGIDDDGNGYIDDYGGYNLDGGNQGEFYWNTYAGSLNNHGTLTSGIAGADFDNGIGVAGIGGRAKIFPIRIGSIDLGDSFTAYGYESIIYASVRGFKVLNCSWGMTKEYSELEQSIVNYALAKDVAVVASAGNRTWQGQVEKFFPAGYKGVLGVGVVNNIDRQDPISILGTNCRIMSPAAGNYSTDLDRGGSPYTYTEQATSFASPVVAGALAIARAKYPELNAEQAIEFVRQSTDDISNNFDTKYQKLIPGRLNMLKMVTTDPISIPGIVIDSVKFYDRTGAPTDRFFSGDTILLELIIRNVLGNANGLNFQLSEVYPNTNDLDFIDAQKSNISLNTNQSITLGKFKYVITNTYAGEIYLRLDISGANDYHDFILLDYDNIPDIATFENDRIKFSIGDKGTFGFADGSPYKFRDGFGFIDKNFGSALFQGGVFVTENDLNLVTSFSFGSDNSSFASLKPFYNPKTTASMITNSQFDDTYAEVNQTIELPKSAPWVRIKLDLIDSIALGSQYSIGYDFDWDVGVEYQRNLNITGFLPSARPQSVPAEKFASVYTGNKNIGQVFGAAIYSDESDAIAQAAGYNYDNIGNLNTEFMINALKNGKTDINSTVGDMFNIIGMRYDNDFADYQTKTCYLCIVAGADTTELSHYLKECASGITPVEIPIDNSIDYNPNNGNFQISNKDYVRAEVYGLNGMKLFSTTENSFELQNLSQGIYFVRIEFKDRYIIKKVSVLR